MSEDIAFGMHLRDLLCDDTGFDIAILSEIPQSTQFGEILYWRDDPTSDASSIEFPELLG